MHPQFLVWCLTVGAHFNIDGRDCCQTGQFSQDVADGALTLILRVLQLRFDESLSYPRISAQTGISKTAIFSLVRRFHQVFTDWPLSGEYSCVQLARALFPGRYPSVPTVTQTVKTEKNRRNRFSLEFKWRLVQQTLLPGACVAQIARENGINDNLLFNWRHLWRNSGLQPTGEHETSLLPVTLTPEPNNKIPASVQIPEQINTPPDSLVSGIYKYCSLVLPRSLGASPCRSAAASTAGSIISVTKSTPHWVKCGISRHFTKQFEFSRPHRRAGRSPASFS